MADHLALARSLARRFSGRGEALEDLEQVAAVAMVAAVDRYDPDHATPFVGYAVPTVLGELKRHFRDRAWGAGVRRAVKDRLASVREAEDRLAAERGRPPTPAQVAEELGVGVDDVLEVLDARRAYRPGSLDAPSNAEAAGTQVGATDPDLAHAEDRLTVDRLLLTLDERERRIVIGSFYEGRSQADIATELGISQMHVSRLLRRALADLAERHGSAAGDGSG